MEMKCEPGTEYMNAERFPRVVSLFLSFGYQMTRVYLEILLEKK